MSRDLIVRVIHEPAGAQPRSWSLFGPDEEDVRLLVERLVGETKATASKKRPGFAGTEATKQNNKQTTNNPIGGNNDERRTMNKQRIENRE